MGSLMKYITFRNCYNFLILHFILVPVPWHASRFVSRFVFQNCGNTTSDFANDNYILLEFLHIFWIRQVFRYC